VRTPRFFRLDKQFAKRLVFLIAAVLASGCSGRTPVPVGVVPQEEYVSAEDEEFGHQVLSQLTRSYPLERDDQAIERVRGLVNRLAVAAHADQHPWNVFVLRGDDVVNAAATRGNYLFVWSGMLRQAPSDGELATVISHELGHLLAGHTKPTAMEEASEIMAKTTGNIAGQIVSTQPGYASLAQLAAVLVSEGIKAIVVNPGSQRLELEADQIGFFLMADAGYDPHEALNFWAKMSGDPHTSGSGLQFLSSHPASSERLETLNQLLPQALERYEQSRGVKPRAAPRPHSAPREEFDSFAIDTPIPKRNR